MSENLLATVVTVAILLSILVWAPLLNVICPVCSRLFHRYRPPADSQPQGSSAPGQHP